MANDCISRERMCEFLAGSLLPEDESQIADHLHGCCDCNRLAFELSDDPVARGLLDGAAKHATQRGGEGSLVDLQRRLAALAILDTSVSDTTSLKSGETPSLPTKKWYDEDVSTSVPQRLGKFEIIRELGAGGFGVVYLAKDTMLDRHVALKLPRSIRLVDSGGRERFFREAQALARLDHPHILPLYEAGEHEGTCYLAVAHCNGPTLDKWRRQQNGPIKPRNAAEIVLLLAEAVEHAHHEGILHRDIKPANVLLTAVQGPRCKVSNDPSSTDGTLNFRQWTPKVADFGLAKIADEQRTSSTVSGTVLGTPDYLSPEQAAGMLDKIGPPTDVYGLGAVLYELLTGQPPIGGATMAEKLRRILVEEPRSPRDLISSVPRDLEAITLKCLQKSPQRRYQSASDLHADLQRFLDGQTVKAPTAKLGIGRAWLKNSPAALRVAIAAGLVVWFGIWSAGFFVAKPRTASDTLQPAPNVNATAASAAATVNVPTIKGPIPAPPGLIAWWSGDGHADDYGGENHGQLVNGAAFAPGLVGQAFRLDGIDDYIRIPHRDALNPKAGFTIEGWLCCDDAIGWHKIINKQNLARHDFSYVMQNRPTGTLMLSLTQYHPWDLQVGTRQAVQPAKWTHFAATFDTQAMRLFINGARDSEQSVGVGRFIRPGTSDVIIGAGEEETRMGQFFTGLIDELCLYDRALTDSEIRSIFLAGAAGKVKPIDGSTNAASTADVSASRPLEASITAKPPTPITPPPGLIAWWSGDGDGRDLVGGHDGIPSNGTTYAPGLVGQAFSLDGIDDMVRVRNADALNPTAGFTIECWVCCKGNKRSNIISKWSFPQSDFSFNLQKWPEGNVQFALSESGRTSDRFDIANLPSKAAIAPETWAHVAVTFDTQTARIYLNGTEDTALNLQGERFIHRGPADIEIGAMNFVGLIDELCLYNRALTDIEIRAIYEAGAAGKIKPTTAASLAPAVNEVPARDPAAAGA